MTIPTGAVYAVAGLLVLLCALVLLLLLWPPRTARAAGGPGLRAAYGYIKGRWPYILGATSAAVVELHAQGVITDSQFKTLLALHAAGIGPALRGAIQHIVGDAIQRKVTVQIAEAKATPVTPKRVDPLPSTIPEQQPEFRITRVEQMKIDPPIEKEGL